MYDEIIAKGQSASWVHSTNQPYPPASAPPANHVPRAHIYWLQAQTNADATIRAVRATASVVMREPRRFPKPVAEGFEPPPAEFVDSDNRTVEIRAFDGSETEFNAVVEMYAAFDVSDRVQGIPPKEESGIRGWLENILTDDCLNAVAWDGSTAAGHSMLVPDNNGDHEIAVFILGPYQNAGIGTQLTKRLLGYGAANGITEVYLHVERWNHPAIALYENVGFKKTNAESFDLEMAIRVAAD